ncbi:serine/threonine dehydratase [Pseudonocardia sp. S2-4]|uniref:Serine/threonine dehydratase n=1 Tax=Pseudonocardia humida TaxID=2800819 RepID=A0ABT1ABJ8_9PSEU|nr:serine/threonine dehydratase [Pseudonocardia humida]
MTPAEVERTRALIAPWVRRTPVVALDPADLGVAQAPGGLVLKLEQLQRAGSFKTRGAFANLLLRAVPDVGVVAASGGNHGVAVAHAAQRLGVRARIHVPTISAPAKIAAIRASGADLVVDGDRYADALAGAREWERRTGALPVHAFDQRETLLGTATLGAELLVQLGGGHDPGSDPGFDTVLVPVGGGGLLGGVAARLAGVVRVVGVEPVEAPTLTTALAAGGPADAPTGGIAADALAPRRVGELVFPIVARHVERVVLVDDAAIVGAQRALWAAARLVAEPAAAVGLAALRSGAYRPAPTERVVVLVSGANTDPGAVAAP